MGDFFGGLAGAFSKGANWLGSGLGLTAATTDNGGTFFDNAGGSSWMYDGGKSLVNGTGYKSTPWYTGNTISGQSSSGGLASYLTPGNIKAATDVFGAYNQYDMNKSYKKNMEADMANQQRLTDASLKAQNWNLQQAKDAEKDKDQFQANAISGFGKAFG